jgi:ferric-dicitrate binding protein FerR (iron transport regulator)
MKPKIVFSLLSLALVSITTSQLRAASVPATANTVSGEAYVVDAAGNATKLSVGDMIPAGDSVRTGTDGSVGLRLVPGANTVIASDSLVKLSVLDYSQSLTGAKTRDVELALEKGSLISSLAKHDGNSQFRINTATGTAAAHGTDWQVSYSAKTGISVACADGTVKLSCPGTVCLVPGGHTAVCSTNLKIVTGKCSQADIQIILSIIAKFLATLESQTGGKGCPVSPNHL